MADPFELLGNEQRAVVKMWDEALPVDEPFLRRAREWVEAHVDGSRNMLGADVLIVRIDVRWKPGSFQIPVEWFVDWRGWEGVATSVRYVTPQTSLPDGGWAAVRAAVLKGFARWFGERTGSRGEFVIAAEDYPVVLGALSEAKVLIESIVSDIEQDDVERARVDFIGRVNVVVSSHAKARALQITDTEMNEQLNSAFDRYIAMQPTRVLYTVLAPISHAEDAFQEAIERLKRRVRPLVARDVEGGAAHFVEAIESALNTAGLRRRA